eukprot:sb/3476203/
MRGSLAHLNTTRDVCAAVSSMSHSIEVSFPKQGDCALLVLVKSIHFEWKAFPNRQGASMDRLRSMATQISQISTRKMKLKGGIKRLTLLKRKRYNIKQNPSNNYSPHLCFVKLLHEIET